MLKKETAEMLGKALPQGITVEELTKAFTSEDEVELTIPEGTFLSKTDKDTLLDNHGKTKYDSGKVAGSEMTLKEIKEKAELDIQGKDIDSILNALNKKTLEGVNIEPNKKVEELQTSLTALQTKYETDLGVKETELTGVRNQLKGIETTSQIQGFLPELKEGITKDVAITMFNVSHEIKEDGIYKDGQLLKNDLQTPLTLEQSIASFIENRQWQKAKPQGHGNRKPGNQSAEPKTYDDYVKVCESKGWNEGSLQAKEYLKTLKAKNPDFEI